MTASKPAVLFLCGHNAGRSQMAAGWLRHLAGGDIAVFSGGSNPAEDTNPVAVAAMAEVDIDIAEYQPQRWTDAQVQTADVIVSMGCGDTCPVYPGKRYEDWELTDPHGQGLDLVRAVRDEIRARVEELITSLRPDAIQRDTAQRDRWESRYAPDHYIYGTDPNTFLVEALDGLDPALVSGDVLCVADGEGRNGVWLAAQGHRVTSVDQTESGMAKAAALAHERSVHLTTVIADLDHHDLGTEQWDLVVSIFAHMPPPIRRNLHQRIARTLRPGGRLILEAYTPDQVGRGTGGPPVPELTMTLAGLREELAGLDIVLGREMIRPVIEGPGHTGDGAVVQVIARRL